MQKKEIISNEAPERNGPYSQAITTEQLLFCSGQVAKDSVTGKLVPGGVREQTLKTLKNIEAILKGAGCGFDDVLKTNIFLKNLASFPIMNEVYRECFREPYPARTTVEVPVLPMDAEIEIEVIAKVGK